MTTRIVSIREQRLTQIAELTDEEAVALVALGRDMAAGSSEDSVDDAHGVMSPAVPSLIEVQRRPGDAHWSIKVTNAVGSISVGKVQILVEPKIPAEHFAFLLHASMAGDVLRISEGENWVSQSDSFLAAVWISFLDALSVTLRADLHHEYLEVSEDVSYVRGRIDPVRAIVNLSKGSFVMPCTFEDLSVNNPVNRALRAACVRIMALSAMISQSQGWEEGSPQRAIYNAVNRRSWEASCRLGGIGELKPGDLESEIPRLAQHQLLALQLARTILRSLGRTVRIGDQLASCFLIPTPPVIEAAVRNILHAGLGRGISVSKYTRGAAGMSFNPDLVVSMDGSDRDTVIATGDVKYRVRDGLWPRSTFEQMVVFAEVFNSPQGFFIDFEIGDVLETSKTEIIEGRKYHRLSWRANPNTEPLKAALDLVEGCRDLLGLNQSLSHGVTVQ